MRIIAKRTLRVFWESNPKHLAARAALEDWCARAKAAEWSSPAHLKAEFAQASILEAGRVVFNIAGHKFRLVVRINYPFRVIYVRFVGTREEYNQIDAQTI